MKTILSNDTLEVIIASPYSIYKGSRFDGTGIITDIRFLGHSFCQVEQKEIGKGSGGIGFSNEFGIDKAIDYEKTPIGKRFPKIGVGMLKKESEESYDFFANYESKLSSFVEEVIDEHTYKVKSIINDQKAYYLILTKTISIKDKSLTIDYVLENKGSQSIETNEYNHNFIGIDDDPIGESYSLDFPNVVEVDKKAGFFDIVKAQAGYEINWKEEPCEDFYGMMKLGSKTCDYNWELKHWKSKLGIRECSNFPISKVALWGYTHVVCPELFINIKLASKESISWSRRYEFFEI